MNITDSVLTSIKKLLGIAEEYEHFDADLIMHINSYTAWCRSIQRFHDRR